MNALLPAGLRFSEHDGELPPDAAAAIGDGLDAFNAAAAPLHEVRPLAVFAHDDAGAALGGAVGRTWGPACELQELWVAEAQRGSGLGTVLLQRFEARAEARGCRQVYLYTFSFQARGFYARQGYAVAHALDAFPHGIVKFTMTKALG